jgi:diadenosine tetraphosphatase ApaH/serine/threonine PP2A family protein phosphatase
MSLYWLPALYQQALVCPGSVGQPRNGRQEAQFAIYDKEQQQVTFIGLPYDNAPVIAKLRQFNLPEELSLRLLNGR